MTGSDLTAILVAPSGLDHLGGVDPRLAKPRLGLNSGRCSAACRIPFSRGEEVNLPNTNHSIDACARKHYNLLEFKVFFGIQLQG